MKRIKELIWYFLFVSAIECYEIKIPDHSTPKSSPITHIHTRKLLELCFSDQLNPVVIESNLIDIVNGMESNEEINLSVIPIDTHFINVEGPGSKLDFIVQPSYPTFIFASETITYLYLIQRRLSYFNYWSNQSPFFVIGNTCSDALQQLKNVVSFGAHTSYYICPNKFNNSTSIYTLNPYTDRAPKLWRKVQRPKEPYSGSTLYKISSIDDAKICSNITFDKTKFLDGHKIQTSYNLYRTDSQYLRKNLLFYENLFSGMNLTYVNESYHPENAEILYTPDPAILRYIYSQGSNIVPYFAQEGYIIITQKQSFIPTFDQVIDSFFTRERIAMSCVILTFFFLMMLLNHKYDFNAAVLDLLSFLLDMGISTPMLRVSMRITFMTASLFALIFNPVFQGQLTSFLSRPGHGNVETLQDLRDNNYHVYFSNFDIAEEISYSGLWNEDFSKKYLHQLTPGSRKFCLENVGKDPSIACVVDDKEFKDIDPKTHISNLFSYNYRVYVTPKNNLLNRKINKIALKLFETGYLSHAERGDFHRILLARRKKLNRINALRKYNQLDLEDFRLAYIAVVLAFAWAILVFGIEVTFRKLEARLDKRSKERELRKLTIRRRIVSTANRINNLTQ
ncbi:uncharacterized protein LOC130674514 [Microplitis mediator]|uniref:uncharacterized protein LOC130674514 n=1 Tax=Microplitis mediator TaxID=375433 RepID=UPI0025579729|nr:uncharacterized protein LOC130674514 [Microplitis mediator]